MSTEELGFPLKAFINVELPHKMKKCVYSPFASQ